MRIRFAMLSLAFLAAGEVPASAEKRVALVIGNSAYQNVPKLANPASDSKMVADALKKSGFDNVLLRTDVTKSTLRVALRDFADQSRDSDIAVVYYAGHGIEVGGTNYLIPVDATLERDTDVYDETYALDRVLVSMETAKRLRLVILDACRDNPFGKSMKRSMGTRAIGARGLAVVEPASPNTMIAFAAKAGSTASDGSGSNSPFATAIVNNFSKPGLDLRKAFGFVRDDVLKVTNNQQEPFIYGSLGGEDVMLVPGPVATATPAAAESPSPATGPQFTTVDSTEGIRRDYELALQVGTKTAWEYFIANYPKGFYSDLARAQNNKLAALESQQSAHARSTSSDVDIPRQVQSELKRVGCYSGEASGNWNSAAQRSMDLFNKYAGTKFDVKIASLDSLEVIKGRTGRICPLVCAHGFQVDGDTCTKITCKNGYEVGDDNTCERIIVRKPPPRAAPVARDYAPRRGPPQDDVVVRRGPPPQQNNDAAIIGGAIGGALLGGAIGGRW